MYDEKPERSRGGYEERFANYPLKHLIPTPHLQARRKDVLDFQRCMMRSRERLRGWNEQQFANEPLKHLVPKQRLHAQVLFFFTATQKQRDRVDRARRVAFLMKEESSRVSEGKYKPLTLMGLSAEIQLRIMEVRTLFFSHYQNFQADMISLGTPNYFKSNRLLEVLPNISGIHKYHTNPKIL